MRGKPEDWKILDERVVYDHRPWLRLIEQDVQLPDGQVIEKWLISEAQDVVMIFAVTESDGAIFVEQYKHGMRSLSLDLSAGYVDASDTSPLSAAQRELEEETGYVSATWTCLASLVVSPNRSKARIHYYLATGCRPDGTRHLDPTEDLAVHLFPLASVGQLVPDGRVETVSSAAGIALGLHALAGER